MAQNKRIIIPCRIAYLNCWKPSSAFGGDKYSLVAIISKSDAQTLETIQSAIDYVKEKSVEKWGGRIPPNWHSPLHDGDLDKPDNPVFKDSYFLNAKCRQPPEIIDQNVEPIKNPRDLYSGCYGNISLTFYSYNCGGNKGIGVWLGNIQKVSDGPKLNGCISASAEFRPVTHATL